MNLSEALKVGTIKVKLQSADKFGAINELIDLADEAGVLSNKDDFRNAILARERRQSTGLEEGVAVPHALSQSVKQVFACLGISKGGIEFQSLDGKPAKLIFLIGAPPGMNTQYLSVLSKVARIFIKRDMRNKVLSASSPEEVMGIIEEEEDLSGH
ncbi:TPA: PTS sugar transporter subunit IIA [Candidatus Poribacteria bacterium]|nr:PTS sugar transporter subunit IIA [Candidatus Poribacteria bacterium]